VAQVSERLPTKRTALGPPFINSEGAQGLARKTPIEKYFPKKNFYAHQKIVLKM